MFTAADALAILLAKRRDLELQVNEREEIQVEALADPLDVSTAQARRDAAAGNINRAVVMLREVNAALKRIKEGTFGECVDCEKEIPLKRLVAVPWAARCVPCQEAYDVEMEALGDPKRMTDKKKQAEDGGPRYDEIYS